MARVDLELILGQVSGEPITIEDPANVLRHITAEHIVTHDSSPAYELILVDRRRAIAFIQSAGRTGESEWYPIPEVSTQDEVNTTRSRLERAACRYLEIEEFGAEMILSGLADGAGNGLGACMLYRTLTGGLPEESREKDRAIVESVLTGETPPEEPPEEPEEPTETQ